MKTRRQRRKKILTAAKAATAVLLVLAATLVLWANYPAAPKSTLMQEFFSTDDGKTWFADDGTKIAPFDHNGKPAVLVRVYQAKDGHPFVAYMMKFTDEAKNRILQTQATHQAHPGPSTQNATGSTGLLVKRPQDRDWIPDADSRAKDIQRISKDCVPVRP